MSVGRRIERPRKDAETSMVHRAALVELKHSTVAEIRSRPGTKMSQKQVRYNRSSQRCFYQRRKRELLYQIERKVKRFGLGGRDPEGIFDQLDPFLKIGLVGVVEGAEARTFHNLVPDL